MATVTFNDGTELTATFSSFKNDTFVLTTVSMTDGNAIATHGKGLGGKLSGCGTASSITVPAHQVKSIV